MPDTSAQGLMSCTVCHSRFPENELVRYHNDHVCVNCKDSYFQRIREGVEPATSDLLQYSSVRRRFAAVAIDGVILYAVQMGLNLAFLGSVLGSSFGNQGSSGKALGATVIVSLLSIITGVAYYVFFIGWKGATPGKMILKIKVVRPDGQPVGYGRAFLRYIGYIVSGITLGFGYIMAIWDDEKRALHDRIASTRVIYN
jgi:uncharacterized RDD family membrane protein YckC